MDKAHVSDGQGDSASFGRPQQTLSFGAHEPPQEKHVASAAVGHDGVAPAVTAVPANQESEKRSRILASVNRLLTWTPRRCRYDPNNPPKFGWGLNLIFALVSLINRMLENRMNSNLMKR